MFPSLIDTIGLLLNIFVSCPHPFVRLDDAFSIHLGCSLPVVCDASAGVGSVEEALWFSVFGLFFIVIVGVIVGVIVVEGLSFDERGGEL